MEYLDFSEIYASFRSFVKNEIRDFELDFPNI